MSTACNDQHPAISKDGLSLCLSSDRPGGCGGLDIWVAQRSSVDSAWEEPFKMDQGSNDILRVLVENNGHLFEKDV